MVESRENSPAVEEKDIFEWKDILQDFRLRQTENFHVGKPFMEILREKQEALKKILGEKKARDLLERLQTTIGRNTAKCEQCLGDMLGHNPCISSCPVAAYMTETWHQMAKDFAMSHPEFSPTEKNVVYETFYEIYHQKCRTPSLGHETSPEKGLVVQINPFAVYWRENGKEIRIV